MGVVRIETLLGLKAEQWRQIVVALDGTPLHLPEPWLIDYAPAALVPLAFRDDREIVGAVVAIRHTRRFLRLWPKPFGLYLPTAPALKQDGLDKESLYASLVEYARREGYCTLVIEPRWGDNLSSLCSLSKSACPALIEFTIDLRHSLEQLTAAIHKKHRKNVRIAEQAGVSWSHDTTLDGMLMLRTLQMQSAERGAQRGNVFQVSKEEFYRKTYEAVYRNGPGRLMIATLEGRPVAALAYLEFGKKAVTVRSGSNREGYETSAMYLLQCELIRNLKERGVEELNIGGVPVSAAQPGHPQHGLYDYKRYYGGAEHVRSRVVLKLR
jgi:hypothetical protein